MITSLNNDRVRKVVSYIEKNKARREDDVFVIEGMKMHAAEIGLLGTAVSAP